MKNRHPSRSAIELYRARQLGSDELVEMTSHLASCAECRKAVSIDPTTPLIRALGEEHLTFEQLEDLSGKLPPDPTAALHLSSCPMCANELADLRAFRASLQPRKQPGRLRFFLPAGALAVATLVILTVRFTGQRTAVVPSVPPPGAVIVASLLDNGHTIWLDTPGSWRGIDFLPQQSRDAVLASLTSGELPKQVDLKDVTRSRETLLGELTKVQVIPEGPVGIVVLDDRPSFRWKAPAGSSAFHISVFDTDFNAVAVSPSLTGHEWRPKKALPRGKVYLWTVTTSVGGESVTAPQSPEPEARFRIASVSDAAALKAVEGSRLAFALTAWRLGMKQDARAAMAVLHESNPASEQVARLSAAMAAGRQQ
ncbi:MAG: hypothetical protein JWN34_5042 [Bryobacterales bacterium]|nr:hypothetical protein [Bryobacterales bacterium]